MAEEVNRSIENYQKKRKKKKSWKKVLRVLSCIVVFCTVYALIIPAITQERNTYCGKEEHIHDEACYAQVTGETSNKLVCELEEKEAHLHGDECYESKPVLTCSGEPDQEHVHEETCYSEDATEMVLVCEVEEGEGHTHAEECYSEEEAEPQLNCTLEEGLSHKHNERCYGTWELVCVSEEHSHEVTCYADGLQEDPVLTDEVIECTKIALIYTNEIYEELSEDSTVITLAGMMPESSTVKAYPVEITDGEDVICAYDISIYKADGSLYDIEENGNITVSIEAEALKEEAQVEEQTLEVCYVPEEGEPEVIQSTVTEEGVTFEAEHFSVYMVRAVGARASDPIADLTALRAAVGGNFTGEKMVVLTGNIEVPDGTSGNNGIIQITSGKNVTLDLNGYTIEHKGDSALFQIESGATFTLIDSAAANTGQDGKFTVDYKIMTVGQPNANTGATVEKINNQSFIAKGLITTVDQPVFRVTGGTLNMQGGMLYGGINRAIRQESGTTNLSGGCIAGFEKSISNNNSEGGAVYTTGGYLNISEDVILTNNKAYRGSAIYAKETEVKMSGGVISGNISTQTEESEEGGTHYGGAGMYLDESLTTISGGYITMNTVDSPGYFDGGGAILAAGEMTLNMTGGCITGNSASSGGGIRTNWWSAVTFTMTGGYVCSNIARDCEGGGISININSTGSITGGYINNNKSETDNDWGGGGVFCSTGSTLYIRNVLVTDNHAEGFGGGVAGCSTGRVYICVSQGGAIYDNTADGTSVSGDTSTKNEDHIYAKENKVFTESGYADYFCALNSIVEGKMLGGHAANWSGSVDNVVVSEVGATEVLSAAYIMGLTADPSEDGKKAAQTSAQVHINNNFSGTHGGGILCNGYMIIGETNNIRVGARIELQATKQFLGNGGALLDLTNGQFTFKVVDVKNTALISTAQNDEKGQINFSERLAFTKAGTYVYEIEEIPGNQFEIAYDTSKYRLTVRVEEETDTFAPGIERKWCKIKNIKIEKYDPEIAEWQVISENNNPSNKDDGAVVVNLTKGATFTNVLRDNIEIKVKKVWDGVADTTKLKPVIVDLLCNGEVVQGSELTLSSNNSWSAIWKELPLTGKNEDGSVIQYTYNVKERSVEGYVPYYEIINDSQISGVWIPATSIQAGQKYILVNQDLTQVFNVSNLNNLNDDYGTADKKAISSNEKVEVVIGGVTYQNAILDTAIPESCELGIASTKAHENERTILKLLGLNGESWLLAQGGNSLKGCNSSAYASGIEFTDNILKMQWEWDEGNAMRVVAYYNNRFTTLEDNNTGRSNAVRLYRYTNTAIDSDTTVKITNRRIEDLRFEIDITKRSGIDNNMLLKGAHFNLLNSENEEAYSFLMGESGVYTYAPAEGNDTTQDLVTGERGKLVLKDLPAGTYILRETEAPVNHEPIEDMTITFGTAESDGTISLKKTLTIIDPEESYALPETGGIGTTIFYLVGAAMVIGVIIVAVTRRRMDGGDEE